MPERSPEEREAARRERERRRGRLVDPLPLQTPEPDADGGDRPPGEGDGGHLGHGPTAGRQAEADVELEPDGEPELGGELERHAEPELPSGTRRVRLHERPARPRRVGRATELPAGARGRTGPAPRRSSRSRGGRLVALLIAIVAAAAAWFAVGLFQPFGTSPHGRVTVVIAPHTTTSQIGDQLARDGVISSAFFFRLRAELDGKHGKLLAGTYHLQKGMSYSAVLAALTTPPPAARVSEITIVPGERRAQIALLLREQHVRGNYLAATRTTRLLDFRAYGLRHPPPMLEGFLFPDTYQVIDPPTVSALVDDQLRRFKQEFATVDTAYARRRHLTPYDVLIIASLIEAETPTQHDRPLVSSVIYNRLADGMTLGLDSTTQYATGNFTRPLTVSQLNSSSPYNTRNHPGLPPTPIDNPSLASIQAAAHPARTDYLYFVARPCQRGSFFTSSYSRFLQVSAQYAARHC